ncbi:MAG: DNA polymerase III subunit [Bryobacteraceae bacterium]|nr:DNA polymerase III subunit [Bryobacteraceae bacterium]
MSFERFYGNPSIVRTLDGMIRRDKIPQTILVSGPEGVGKATLARRFAAALIGDPGKIEHDDLSLPENASLISDREKWPSEKRSDDPLLFSSHPDFITFPPDGPLKVLSIQQMRVLRERANFKPLKGRYRVFLIDRLDKANEQAANSLLKTLEEPPDHLILFVTAQNPYDLLPTIRSRAVMLQLASLGSEDMHAFAVERGLAASDRRLGLAAGRPGIAVTLDLDVYDKRRNAMLRLLNVASGRGQFADWAKMADSVGAGRSDKLDSYLEVLYILLSDVVALQHGVGTVRNTDIRADLAAIARQVDFEWLRRAVAKVDELVEFQRRNIQKSIALDALVSSLRPA